MKILAISNQKGGTGKSTTALTIGMQLANRGRRVLMLDMDPQASLTAWVGIEAAGRSLAEVLGGAIPGTMSIKAITRPVAAGLDLAPGDIALSSCELGLVGRFGREIVLKRALASVGGYDVVIIDCPPALGLLTVSALVAADAVIAPVLPAAADLRGLRLFMDTLAQMRELNPALQLLGVLIVQFDGRLNSHKQAKQALESAGLPVLPTVPRSVRVQEAAGAGQALPIYDPAGKPAAAYELVTTEVEKWLNQSRI